MFMLSSHLIGYFNAAISISNLFGILVKCEFATSIIMLSFEFAPESASLLSSSSSSLSLLPLLPVWVSKIDLKSAVVSLVSFVIVALEWNPNTSGVVF